jgi:hypothetical protein
MKKFLFALLAVSTIALTNCSSGPKKYENLDDFNWLKGRWEGTQDETHFIEEWKSENASNFTGFSYAMNAEGDTTFHEDIKIQIIEGTPYYIANVPENKGPVLFKMKSYENHSAIFENLEHDFPQRIIYTEEKEGVLHARIEGKMKGRNAKEEFTFQKIK